MLSVLAIKALQVHPLHRQAMPEHCTHTWCLSQGALHVYSCKYLIKIVMVTLTFSSFSGMRSAGEERRLNHGSDSIVERAEQDVTPNLSWILVPGKHLHLDLHVRKQSTNTKIEGFLLECQLCRIAIPLFCNFCNSDQAIFRYRNLWNKVEEIVVVVFKTTEIGVDPRPWHWLTGYVFLLLNFCFIIACDLC